jgi:hypothetical protein
MRLVSLPYGTAGNLEQCVFVGIQHKLLKQRATLLRQLAGQVGGMG